MAIDVRAELKNYPVSSQKVRLVIDLVRGKMAEEALNGIEVCKQEECRTSQ